MYQQLKSKEKKIAVIGLGYVGLPIALEFARKFSVIGFDIKEERVALMRKGIDPSKELESSAFDGCDIEFTTNIDDLKRAHFFVVAVPTDIDEHRVPNLVPLQKASETVGRAIKKGDYVVYESTVYPGCTEEDCVPIIERISGLRGVTDFKIGYSPERIVPGDKVRTLTKILKIVSGCDAESSAEVAKVYNEIIEAGTYQASCIKVAEAAKVIENTQRDINISLMNELSIIFDKMGIDTKEVIEAAGTKWNFIKLYPGLVGGHCIGVDPYYLLHKARELGVEPQVIASGRRINDSMPAYVAKKLVQMLIGKGKNPSDCKVLCLGITFKEDVSDIRNSKVVNLVRELSEYSVTTHIHDANASAAEVMHEYGIEMTAQIGSGYDAVIVAVGHAQYHTFDAAYYKGIMTDKPILIDLKGIYNRHLMSSLDTWRL
jgi:UDP-N-acetyl-D-glucosamine/UDP-N-acetyl-D-galactosamine dehydrogenase